MSYNDWYLSVKNYFFPSVNSQQHSQQNYPEDEIHMTKINRINRVSSLVNQCSYQQNLKDKLVMYYSELIDEYRNFRSTLDLPYYIDQKQTGSQRVLILEGFIRVETAIKCDLMLAVIFPLNFDKQMPKFILCNPNYQKIKPKEKYCINIGKNENINGKYQCIFGGVRVIVERIFQNQWNWDNSYYKQINILRIIKWINNDLLCQNFPFVKRKIEQNQKNSEKIKDKLSEAKSFLEQNWNFKKNNLETSQRLPILNNIQTYDILRKSIEQEHNQKNNFKQQIQTQIDFFENEKDQTESVTPLDKNSSKLLELVAQFEAIKDVENIVEGRKRIEDPFKIFKQDMQKVLVKKFLLMYQLRQFK